MGMSGIGYCFRQVRIIPVVAVLPATFVGLLKFGVELAYGHSIRVSAGPALLFFGFVYFGVVFVSSVAGVLGLRRKAREAGVSLDFLGQLPREESRRFEKEHGF
jgi:hypothetical protein